MKYLIILLALSISIKSTAQEKRCDKCDLRYVKFVNDNFQSLTEPIVERFLCTMDYSCNLNPKFVQITHNTLYSILETYPELILNCLNKYKYLNKKYILQQIKTPYTKQNFSKAYNKVKSLPDSSVIKNQVRSSIKIAARKYNILL